MQLPMMTAAERHGELIADFEADGSAAGQTADDADRTAAGRRRGRVVRPRISDGLCRAAAWARQWSERSCRFALARGRVRPGQSRCRLTAGLPVCVELEPDPELPDPGGDHSSGTVAGSGSCRPVEADLVVARIGTELAQRAERLADDAVLPPR